MRLFRIMTRVAAVLFVALPLAVHAGSDLEPRPGFVVIKTDKSYDALIKAVKSAASAQKMGIVTQAGPTGAAAKRGIIIPGNRVIGVFNNDFAVKVLATSTAAMIEAPIRFYVTENADDTATLAYKTPSFVFAPYIEDSAEGGATLTALAAELDTIFAAIAEKASQ